VLRDGCVKASAPKEEINISWIINHMTGGMNLENNDDEEHFLGKKYFEIKNVSLPKTGGGWVVNNVSFSLRRGEILGLYGLVGAGRSELFECIIGARPEASGTILIDDTPLHSKDIAGRIKDGIVLIPEDRQREGLIQNLSVQNNMTISSLEKFTKKFSLIKDKEEEAVRNCIQSLSIKTPSTKSRIGALSGGNQQKVVIGKALLTEPKVLLMDEPTRGIDVAAKKDVFKIIRDLAKRGLGIIIATSELKEVLAVSDRIIVLSRGKISGEFNRFEATEEKLIKAASATYV
ncbi:MAG: ATP-binding cassette domain-containing protein, partial [Sulfolobales archaeon]